MKTNADASCSTTFSGMNLRKRKKLLQHCENIVNGQGKGKGHIIWKSTEKMDQNPLPFLYSLRSTASFSSVVLPRPG